MVFWKRYAAIVLTALGVLLALPAAAGDKVNVLVFNEDQDTDAIPADSRIHGKILDSVRKEFANMDIAVYDETFVSNLGMGFAQNVRRSDAEILDIARSVQRPPIDVAVVYTVYASARQLSYATPVVINIEGRMINVRTGQFYDSFDFTSPRELKAPAKCNRDCIIRFVGEQGRREAEKFGVAMASKLSMMIDSQFAMGGGGASDTSGIPNAYTLEFSGFTPEDMNRIEEYLVIFSGYESHRPIYSGPRRSEIWYESKITSAKLTRNLNKMLAELDIQKVMEFSGNTVRIEKITPRGANRPSNIDDSDW
jgi:hypothetical protein